MTGPIADKPPRWTVFDTPILHSALRWISLAGLRLAGWHSRIDLPSDPKYVLIVAPHTSYWDLPILLATALELQVRGHWLGKHTLFRGPFRPLFRWLGGIPVDPAERGRGQVAAVVPLVLWSINYGTKTVATGDCFVPSGDMNADFKRARSFCANVRGRHPHRFSLPQPESDAD